MPDFSNLTEGKWVGCDCVGHWRPTDLPEGATPISPCPRCGGEVKEYDNPQEWEEDRNV